MLLRQLGCDKSQILKHFIDNKVNKRRKVIKNDIMNTVQMLPRDVMTL